MKTLRSVACIAILLAAASAAADGPGPHCAEHPDWRRAWLDIDRRDPAGEAARAWLERAGCPARFDPETIQWVPSTCNMPCETPRAATATTVTAPRPADPGPSPADEAERPQPRRPRAGPLRMPAPLLEPPLNWRRRA